MLGRNLGNYGVVSKIGEGGMGVVYLAQHVTLGRKAAIKVLRPALSSNQDVVSRFFNEARAVTAVRNPGIVDVYDFGFLEDRTAYIIMEYLDGESLAARLRRGRTAIPWTLTVVRAMTRALQAAHEQSIVHRDLKPDNVFLVPDADLPGGERVKLLDFGIAKLAHGVGDASQTTTGTVMGTPTYMSPEQCRGAGSVDHRADLYSLGCVAYEMLCGQPPFVADGPGDVIARHLYFEPPSLRSHRSDIPPELEELVLKLLKKEPRARFTTAADLVRAIDQLSVAPLPAVAPSKPLATEFVATLAVVKDTTLNGAASSRVSVDKDDRSRRVGIISAAVTVAIAAFVLVWFFARGGHDADSGSPLAAALPTESKASSEVAAPPGAAAPATPAPSAPTPRTAPPSLGVAPAIPPPPPIDHVQGSTAASSGGSTGEATGQPKSVAPVAPPPREVMPSVPEGAPRAPSAGDTAVPGSLPKPRETAAVEGAESRGDAATPGDATHDASKARAVQRPASGKRPAAPRPRPGDKPTKPGEPASPDEFPRWTDTLKSDHAAPPPGPATTGDPEAASSTPGADAPGRGDATPPAGQGPSGSKSPAAAASPLDTGCTRAAFDSVLDAKAPSKKAVKDASNRLGRCKASMDPGLYEDIHRRLIELY